MSQPPPGPPAPTNSAAMPAPARSAGRDAATPLSQREWGPDIARGIALLGIAVANMYYYLHSSTPGPFMKPEGSTGASLGVDVATVLLFDNRGFTLFSLLFGYGIGMLYARSQRRGESKGQFMLHMLARHGLLLAIGVLHAVLLFAGDIIVTYALLGIIVAALAIAPRWVRIVVLVLTVPALLFMGVMDSMSLALNDGAFAMSGQPDTTVTFLGALGFRLIALLFVVLGLPFLSIGILVPMLIGLVLQRWGFFGKARERMGLMAGIAAGGVLISLLGALPAAWAVIEQPQLGWLAASGIGALHQLTGLAGAVGYAALAAIVGVWRPAVLFPLAALGTMSMSAYLFQSVVAVTIYPAWAFGVGGWISSWGAFWISLGTWLATVVIATLLLKAGKRGPVEWLFRRVLYGAPAAPAPPASGAPHAGPR